MGDGSSGAMVSCLSGDGGRTPPYPFIKLNGPPNMPNKNLLEDFTTKTNKGKI